MLTDGISHSGLTFVALSRSGHVQRAQIPVGLNGYAVDGVKIATGHDQGSIEPGGAEVPARSSKEGRPQ